MVRCDNSKKPQDRLASADPLVLQYGARAEVIPHEVYAVAHPDLVGPSKILDTIFGCRPLCPLPQPVNRSQVRSPLYVEPAGIWRPPSPWVSSDPHGLPTLRPVRVFRSPSSQSTYLPWKLRPSSKRGISPTTKIKVILARFGWTSSSKSDIREPTLGFPISGLRVRPRRPVGIERFGRHGPSLSFGVILSGVYRRVPLQTRSWIRAPIGKLIPEAPCASDTTKQTNDRRRGGGRNSDQSPSDRGGAAEDWLEPSRVGGRKRISVKRPPQAQATWSTDRPPRIRFNRLRIDLGPRPNTIPGSADGSRSVHPLSMSGSFPEHRSDNRPTVFYRPQGIV